MKTSEISTKRLIEIQDSCKVCSNSQKPTHTEAMALTEEWLKMPGHYSFFDTVTKLIIERVK